MSNTPFMPLWVADFVGDTLDLDAKEIGAYMLILMTMWGRNGYLPIDERKLQRVARCGRDWPRVWASLSHYFTHEGDLITQGRLLLELQKVAAKREVNAQHGALGGRAKSLKSKEPTLANANGSLQQPEPYPEPDKKEREVNLSRASGEVDGCIAYFNAVADRVGWSQVQKITPARKSALIHRMADCGGADAWCEAMDRAASSPLLTGQTGRGWRADFDWLCKAANFTKLMEGNYDPRNSDQGQPRPGQGNSMAEVFMAVGAARSRRAGTSGGGGEWPDGSVQ
jgi:uncharacterized protein YdaU (DUF1376 family)